MLATGVNAAVRDVRVCASIGCGAWVASAVRGVRHMRCGELLFLRREIWRIFTTICWYISEGVYGRKNAEGRASTQ